MKAIRISLCAAAVFAIHTAAQMPTAITMNVVVKDKKGAPAKGLAAEEFQVSDNGARAAGLSVKMVDSVAGPKLIALVFEQMDNEQRRLAKMIALDMFRESKDLNHNFGVFMISNQLSLLQPFTTDRDDLRRAVDLATSGALNTRFADVHQESLTKLRSAADDLSRIQLRMMTDRKFSDEEGNRRAVAYLDSIATGLGSAPGRKTVAYLTWGMFVPAFLDVPFLALQARANRGGVSFYGIDCRGVVTYGQNRSTADFTGRAGAQVSSGGTENAATVNYGGLDQVQDGVRLNLQANLRVLSEATGGLFAGDTNDPKPFVRQMLDDASTYYELTYDPGITVFDGSYRKTSVSVAAKDVRVRDRDGYFALRPDQQELLPYEVAMLEALGKTPMPRDVAFRSGTLRLRRSADSVTAAVLVEVPFSGVLFKEDAPTSQYLARLSMLVQVKDAGGNIVQKFSRDLPLMGKLEQLPALRNSNFSFREQFTAPAGRYVIESVVADQLAGKIAARRTSFVAQARPAGVSISSLAIVRSFLPNAKDLTPDEPFQYQGGRITPTFINTLKRVKGAQMAFFFMVYADPGATGTPQATVQYLKDGMVVGDATLPLASPDAQGRIPYVLSSPIDTMLAGSYEIKVTVRHGGSSAQESAFVTIEGQDP